MLRKHKLPWSFRPASFEALVVEDADGEPVLFVYHLAEGEPPVAGTGRRKHTKREAEVIARWVVRKANEEGKP
jgi:hypothetical protein